MRGKVEALNKLAEKYVDNFDVKMDVFVDDNGQRYTSLKTSGLVKFKPSEMKIINKEVGYFENYTVEASEREYFQISKVGKYKGQENQFFIRRTVFIPVV